MDSLLHIGTEATPTLTNPGQTNAGAIHTGLNQAGSLVASDLAATDSANNAMYRAQMIEAETKHQQQLQLPLALSKLQEITMGAVEQITGINEVKRKADLRAQNTNWVTNQSVNLETNFNNFLRDAKANANPDGSGFEATVQNWLNQYEKDNFKNAPSSEGLTAMYAHSSAFKVNALKMAGDFESTMRAKNRIDVTNQSVGNLSMEAYNNPEAIGSALSHVDSLAQSVKQDFQNPADAEKFINSSKSTIYMSGLKGMLGRNDFNALKQMYNNKELQSVVNPDEIQSFMGQAAHKEAQVIKAQIKVETGAMLTKAFQDGKLTAGMPGADKAENQNFLNFMSSLGDTSQLKPDQIGSAMTSIMQYFNKNNSFISDDTQKIIVGKINSSNNPNESALFSTVVNALSKDPTNTGFNIIKNIKPEDRLLAYKISDIYAATGDPVKAVTMAQEIHRGQKVIPEADRAAVFNKEFNTGMNAVRDKMASEYNSLFDTQYIGSSLTDSEKASGAAELKRYTMDYIASGHNPEDALTLAKDQVKGTRATSTVNGRDEVMVAAPELYYPKGVMLDAATKVLQDAVSKEKLAVDAKNPGKNVNIGIAAYDGITQFQSNKERWYILKDLDNNLPLTDSTGAYRVVPVKIDEEKIKADQAKAVADISSKYEPVLKKWAPNLWAVGKTISILNK